MSGHRPASAAEFLIQFAVKALLESQREFGRSHPVDRFEGFVGWRALLDRLDELGVGLLAAFKEVPGQRARDIILPGLQVLVFEEPPAKAAFPLERQPGFEIDILARRRLDLVGDVLGQAFVKPIAQRGRALVAVKKRVD